MIRLQKKKKNILNLIKLLKLIKLRQYRQLYSNKKNKKNRPMLYNNSLIRNQLNKAHEQKMNIRNYYINMFIGNKKIEMSHVRNLVQSDNSNKKSKYLKNEEPVPNYHYFIKEEEDNLNIQNNYHYFIEEDNKTKNNNSDSKILVILAIHSTNLLRFKSLTMIMHFLSQIDNIDITIVNSSKTFLSDHIKQTFKNKYLNYFEIHNDNYFGFSKWYYGIMNTDITKYKFVTFLNDSIIIHSSISHFFDYTRLKDVDLYGYNDSNQINYHYQSYFFSIKVTALHNFIRMIHERKHLIHSYFDAVTQYELKLLDYFSNRDCFLKIAHFPFQIGKNIFVENDFLYFKLRDSGLLPFSKLKRIINN